ncbi:hypothetical protein GCM10017083_32250 [Thalassobaculum fulvum]|uniref:Uncharacterized protein n=1 Tax=Thalassobaculum fulvum TaxID=1633335 RepID=A0A918XUW3_9PROT|nr:hypothetical protein GCM10017083_32250 [Thalassobaculum fulvum]
MLDAGVAFPFDQRPDDAVVYHRDAGVVAHVYAQYKHVLPSPSNLAKPRPAACRGKTADAVNTIRPRLGVLPICGLSASSCRG